MDQLIEDCGYSQGKQLYRRLLDSTKTWDLEPPRVNTYPIYSLSAKTESGYIYNKDNDFDS